jgi:hypothetical protein
MSTVRRRILRSQRAPAVDPRLTVRLERLSQKLERERAAHSRWMAKLKRAFHAMERGQRRITRLEKQLSARPD